MNADRVKYKKREKSVFWLRPTASLNLIQHRSYQTWDVLDLVRPLNSSTKKRKSTSNQYQGQQIPWISSSSLYNRRCGRVFDSQAGYNHRNNMETIGTWPDPLRTSKTSTSLNIKKYFQSAPLTSGHVQCWCCLQKQNVHRVALVYYKNTVLINQKTNRRTRTERPCPLMWILQISFPRFQKLTIPAQESHIHFPLVPSPCPPATVWY